MSVECECEEGKVEKECVCFCLFGRTQLGMLMGDGIIYEFMLRKRYEIGRAHV